eukprot:4271135-Amphidinium_carterae.1
MDSLWPASQGMRSIEVSNAAVDKAYATTSKKKASTDAVHPSAWKVNEAGVKEAVRNLCRRITQTGQAPKALTGSRLYILKKKTGQADLRDSYRGISIMAAVAKIQSKLLLDMICSSVQRRLDILDSTSNTHMALLHLALTQHQVVMNSRSRSTGYIFVDVVKAFDSLIRVLLFAQTCEEAEVYYANTTIPEEQRRSVIQYIREHPCILAEAGAPPNLITTVACWTEHGWTQLDAGCGGCKFTAQQGAKQGDALAPLLFAHFRRKVGDDAREQMREAGLLSTLPVPETQDPTVWRSSAGSGTS